MRNAGKASPGLAKFWDGTRQKACSGLERSCCSLMEVKYKQAFSLAFMTPAVLEGRSLDVYVDHMQTVLSALPTPLAEQIRYVVGDGYYAQQRFVAQVQEQRKHCVGKLSCDANLKYLYGG